MEFEGTTTFFEFDTVLESTHPQRSRAFNSMIVEGLPYEIYSQFFQSDDFSHLNMEARSTRILGQGTPTCITFCCIRDVKFWGFIADYCLMGSTSHFPRFTSVST
jgi:hypothetical protein